MSRRPKSTHHFAKTIRQYRSLGKKDATKNTCAFCTSAQEEPALAGNETMYVIANRTSYDIFEGYRVAEHLMIIPKAHRASLAEFTENEMIDFMRLAGEYEAKGYSVYARGVDSPTRSVAHQHTHLIKLTGKAPNVMLYTSRPHVLIAK